MLDINYHTDLVSVTMRLKQDPSAAVFIKSTQTKTQTREHGTCEQNKQHQELTKTDLDTRLK